MTDVDTTDLQITYMKQRSPEWYDARCGMVTASAVGDLISVAAPRAIVVACPTCKVPADEPCIALGRKTATPITGFHGERTAATADLPPVYSPATGDTARGLLTLLAAERITGHVDETYTSRDMERGILAEPFARDLYGGHHAQADEAGFMVRDFGDFKIGYSPDGLVGSDGLIEIKAPRQKGELRTILAGEVPDDHMPQLQAGLLVSGRAWIDFISYCGGMPLWVKRVTPDPVWQAAILAAVEHAEAEIADMLARYEEAVVGLPIAERISFDAEVF